MSDQPLRVRLGNWDRNICQCDFDDTPFEHVKYWASRALVWFKKIGIDLKGFIIFESSQKEHHPVEVDGKVVARLTEPSYHLVFDGAVSWAENLHVINWIALESQNENVQRYAMMQAIKETSTIRQGPKGDKPSPRIVYRFGSQEGMIQRFLEHRRFIKQTLKRNEKLGIPVNCPDVDCLLKHLDAREPCVNCTRLFWELYAF